MEGATRSQAGEISQHNPPVISAVESWARGLALSLSLLLPASALTQRAKAQETGAPGTTLVSTKASTAERVTNSLDVRLAPVTPVMLREAKLSDNARHELARSEHRLIFGDDSGTLLVWPDHYLSYERLGNKTLFESNALWNLFLAENRRLIPDGSSHRQSIDDAVSTVRATTTLLGPAAFPIAEGSPESQPIIAVVGYDSARPRSLALKSLAGISCPSVMLTQQISRDDLHAFVRFHESGHVFQHRNGRVKPNDVETPYERCRIEAEADVFATLWWLKTRSGDQELPCFFSKLRISNFLECSVAGDSQLAMQYATVAPLLAGIERGAHLARVGTLEDSSAYDLYIMSRAIVDGSLPQHAQLEETIRLLNRELGNIWGYPLRERAEMIRQALAQEEIAQQVVPLVELYLESITSLASPQPLLESRADLNGYSMTQKAEIIWLEELLEDVRYSTAPLLVIERYENDLSAAALALWRLSVTAKDPESLKNKIKHSGSPDELFVPLETRANRLGEVKQVLIEIIGREKGAP